MPRKFFLSGLFLAVCFQAGVFGQVILEKPGDPAGPPAPRSGYGPTTAGWSIVKFGPFESIQVNVDKFGRNIKGDAANEPSIAVDPTDPKKVVIGWRQFDTITSNFRQNGYAWSHDGGKTWTFPGPIQKNVFNSDPVLDTDVKGNFYYLSYPGGRTLKLFRSFNGGVTFSGPTYLTGGDKPWMLVDKSSSIGRGNIYVIWQVAHGPKTFSRSTNGGVSFSSPVSVPYDPTFGTLAQDKAGTLYAFGLYNQYFSRFVLARSTTAKDRTKTPTFSVRSVNMGGSMGFGGTPNPNGLLGQAQVVVDPSRPGYVYMLCSVNPPGSDPMDVHFVRSTDGGKTFSSPVRINDDPSTSYAYQWMGTVSVAPNGRIDVVWNDTRGGSASYSRLYYAYSLDAGKTWSKNIPATPKWNSRIGWPKQNKIGDYYCMLSDKAKAKLAFAATFNGEQDVYYLELGDCNKNGVHDSTDIAKGTSYDANKNLIPDECEYCQKSLGNGGKAQLTVCGDDLSKAGSRATLLVKSSAKASPVLAAFSLKRRSLPLPLPWGGALVPDLSDASAFVVLVGSTDSRGWYHVTWPGGAGGVSPIYAQAFVVKGMSVQVSNALEVKAGY